MWCDGTVSPSLTLTLTFTLIAYLVLSISLSISISISISRLILGDIYTPDTEGILTARPHGGNKNQSLRPAENECGPKACPDAHQSASALRVIISGTLQPIKAESSRAARRLGAHRWGRSNFIAVAIPLHGHERVICFMMN